MQPRCRGVEQLLGEDEGHGDSVGDEIFPRHPFLAPVGGRAEPKRPLDQLEVEPVGVTLQHGPQIGSELGQNPVTGVFVPVTTVPPLQSSRIDPQR